MNKPLVLVVEDDRPIRNLIVTTLKAHDYHYLTAENGHSAIIEATSHNPDIVLLDLGLPQLDGLQVLRQLRARKDATPVLVATARDAVHDRIAGLDAGADDYVIKPYDMDELLARIRALTRRAAGHLDAVYEHGGVMLNPNTREASVNGQPVTLSGREWAVLQALLTRPGATLSRQQIEDKLYGWGDEVSSNAVEVYIHGLRKKLGAAAVLNVRGLGYMVPRP